MRGTLVAAWLLVALTVIVILVAMNKGKCKMNLCGNNLREGYDDIKPGTIGDTDSGNNEETEVQYVDENPQQDILYIDE